METELRRRRSELLTLGFGIIAFGVWSVLKTYLYTWVDPLIENVDVEEQYKTAATILGYVMITIVLAMDLGLRLYVGMSARAEGLGKKKGRAYIVVAALMLLVTIFFAQHYRTIFAHIGKLGICVTALILLAIGCASALSRIFRITGRERRTVNIEVGMQNAAQAIALATSPFVFANQEMAIPAILYSLMMNVVLLTYVAIVKRKKA